MTDGGDPNQRVKGELPFMPTEAALPPVDAPAPIPKGPTSGREAGLPRRRPKLASVALVARSRWRDALSWATVLLDRIDPNEDTNADRMGVLQVASLAVALSISVALFLFWKFQPMQDMGHHLAMSAVVADYGRPGSLYPALYEPIDPFAANSLLYVVAGTLGKLVGVAHALRACMLLYVAGVPIATLYALRVFGRSAWGAVLSVPLVYNMNFVAGFANLLFATPMMLVALVLFHGALEKPSVRRAVPVVVLFALVFLAHAHMFLWLGVLAFAVTLAKVVRVVSSREPDWRRRWQDAALSALVALASVAPALLLFARWYARAFGALRATPGVISSTSSYAEGFGAAYKPLSDLFVDLPLYAWKTLISDEDLALLGLLVLLVGVAVAFARMHRFARPPVLEMAFGLTFASYFFLPEGLTGHDVIASRQVGLALLFLPALVSPVSADVSRAARGLVVFGIVVFAGASLQVFRENLVHFEAEEVHGLAEVLDAAPPRMRMHYVKIAPESAYFAWNSFWHVEKYYMADKFGVVADTPGILSTSPIRYRPGVAIHRITEHADDWPSKAEIWENFDLVLVHRWRPRDEDLKKAAKSGELIKRVGDWELWRSHLAAPPAPR